MADAVGRALTTSSGGYRPGRAFDMALACAALLFMLPLLIPIALAIRLTDGGPILIRQERIGRGGRPFACLKFRTAALRAGPADQRGAPRLTQLGDVLRRSSLDGLPQLINVVRGEMSMVGPTPLARSEARHYGRRFAHYCTVRPGITGLWRIARGDDASFRRRVALDTLYVRGRRLSWDMKIMLVTLPAIFRSKGG